jgi:hypothetical protein
MNATALQTRDALHALHGRAPRDIIDDLRAVSTVLNRELGQLDEIPLPGALTTVETSAEGIRRLLTQLRISLSARGIR